jgi:ADP-ribose pyrophosphatase
MILNEKLRKLCKPIKAWRINDSNYIVNDRWLTLRKDICKSSDSRIIDPYYVVEAKNAVHIIAFNDHNEVILTCQYRHGAQIKSFEFPCGEIDNGETPLNAVHRELCEETGFTVREVVFKGSFYSNPSRQTNKVFTFVCYGATPSGVKKLDENEAIEIGFFSLTELNIMIAEGNFGQGLHIASWHLAVSSPLCLK